MKQVALILFLVGVMLAPTFVMAAETIKIGGETPEVNTRADSSDGLTRRQRRALGVTFRNIRRVASELKKAGELSDDPAIASAQVLKVLTEENPKAFEEEAAAINWDALLDFIERLLELILKFLPLFVDNGPMTFYHMAA